MKSNYKVIQADDDHVVLFNNVTETELIFDHQFCFVRGARVIGDQVFDCIVDQSTIVECCDVMFDYYYQRTLKDGL